MKVFLQCPTGVSGDMFLAGLADLGLDLKILESLFNDQGLGLSIEQERLEKNSILGTTVRIIWQSKQPLRVIKDIEDIVSQLSLSPEIKKRSMLIFKRLAQVEAKVHGISMEEVHFHELGALDTLVDIVGTLWALQELHISEIYCSALPWFQGTVDCQHGTYSLPAPATLELLRDKPVYPTELTKELITPTGAVLVDQLVDSFSEGPTGIIQSCGLGWGTYDLGDIPNGLRVVLYSGQEMNTEYIWVLESNIDHLTGEEIGELFEVFFQAGALDVLFIPGLMKKNRPGGMLQVLSREEDLVHIQDIFFQQTLTLGIRRQKLERVTLPREAKGLKSSWGRIEAKEITLKEQAFIKPEYESLRQAAKGFGYSLIQLRYALFDRFRKK